MDVQKTVIENITYDSLEIGTPGKGGCIKIYFDANKKLEAEAKIRNALDLRKMAYIEMEKQ